MDAQTTAQSWFDPHGADAEVAGAEPSREIQQKPHGVRPRIISITKRDPT